MSVRDRKNRVQKMRVRTLAALDSRIFTLFGPVFGIIREIANDEMHRQIFSLLARDLTMTSITRLILGCPMLLIVAACAASPREYVDPRPIPTAEQRAAFGSVGIAAAGVADPQQPDVPGSMSNLGKAGFSVGAGAMGAGAGALIGLSCGPALPLCVPAFAAAGGATGLATGLANTIPYRSAEQVNAADITLRNAMLSTDVEQRLVELVLARAPQMSGQYPRQVGYSADAGAWEIGGEGEVDTRILIAVPTVSLVAMDPDQMRNPDIRLEIVVEGQIFGNDDEAPAFERRWLHDSEVHKYFEWADDQGALVVAEIDSAVAILGAWIAADFLGWDSELTAASPAPADPVPPQDVIGSLEDETPGSD